MTATQAIRNFAFWTSDLLKGQVVRKDLNDIHKTLSLSSFDDVKKRTDPVLNSLLKKAATFSEYYSDFRDYKNLSDFPVVNKTIIKNNLEKFRINSTLHKGSFPVTTSGSTGTPFTVFQTRRKKVRNTADTIFFAKRTGYQVGHKLLYLRLWSSQYKKNVFLRKLQNIVPIDVQDLNNEHIAKLILELQKDKQPKAWLGYPSGFEKICNYLEENSYSSLDCNIQSIIGMSEQLSDFVRFQMEYFFKAPTVSRYSNMENGIIAQQSPGNKFFDINWASYYVEILHLKKDRPVKMGEYGRIVITDLYNWDTPMIRYDTGDIGAFEIPKFAQNDFPALRNVRGRSSDILTNTRGEMISPFKMHSYLHKFPEIEQAQFIQNSRREYDIIINRKRVFYREKELIELFRSDMGLDAIINIKYVNEIPLLSSGKRKLTVNHVA
jgi:phenylacetate-CoA ligase